MTPHARQISNRFGAKSGEDDRVASPGLGDSDDDQDVFQSQFQMLLQKVGNKYISNKKLEVDRPKLQEIQNVPIKANVNDTILASEKSGGRPKYTKQNMDTFKQR